MKRVESLLNRRRLPDEFAPSDLAILNFCAECMGFQPSLIAGCTAPECWLYPLRLGTAERARAMSGPIATPPKSAKIPSNESGLLAMGLEYSSPSEPSKGQSGVEVSVALSASENTTPEKEA